MSEIKQGDCRDLIKAVPDSTVKLILSDPPYASKFNWVFGWLYREASRILVDGGSLIFLLGHSQLEAAMRANYYGLRYWWVGTLLNNRSNRMFGKNVIIRHKPWLWFLKGKRENTSKVPMDCISADCSEWLKQKNKFNWAQPREFATNAIEYLTKPNETVLDPFAGTGAFIEVANLSGRVGIGYDLILRCGTDTIMKSDIAPYTACKGRKLPKCKKYPIICNQQVGHSGRYCGFIGECVSKTKRKYLL